MSKKYKLNFSGFNIGGSNFENLIGKSFYIDKTDHSEIILITWPNRSGKRLNLSITNKFLDITKESKNLFKDTLIYEHKSIIENHLNKYPIICLDFKNLSASNYTELMQRFTTENEYDKSKHSNLFI